MKKIKALALFSGGLDSLLSMKLLIDQGIEVTALHFNIGFGGNKDKREYFENATAQIGASSWCAILESSFLTMCCSSPNTAMGSISTLALIAMPTCLGTLFIKCLN